MNFTSISNGWFILAISIVFGVLGTICLKLSHGFQYLKPTIFLAIFYALSFVGLTFTMKYLELSVVYAVWSGVGTMLVAAIGVIYFKETLSMRRVFFLLFIIAGVIGIHFNDFTSI